MTEASNVGSASHLGEKQATRDSHFVYDYTYRRVPMPVISYLAVADNESELPAGENLSKQALDMLREYVEPAVIAEEELERSHMETLLRESVAKVDKRLFDYAAGKNLAAHAAVSLTVVLTDRHRAYIGHVGTSKIYLLHDERLYDLTPTGGLVSPAAAGFEAPRALDASAEAPRLFDVPGEAEAAVEQSPPSAATGLSTLDAAAPVAPLAEGAPQAPEVVEVEKAPEVKGDAGEHEVPQAQVPPVIRGSFLGQGGSPQPGYNEVQVVPGDTVILCTDGLWKTVTEEEMVENLLGSLNAQRSASQLVRLSFNRDASDNATMVAWQYVVPGTVPAGREREARSRERKSKTVDVVLLALLAMVLAGIFAVGFAFGWRITDAFRKPQKEAAQERREAATRKAEEERKQKEEEARKKQEAEAQAAPQASERTATVNADGVRMRDAADVQGKIEGLLRNGQQVTILGEAAGADGKTWFKIRATVRSQGQDVLVEGFVRNDFLAQNPAAAPPTATTPSTTP